MGLAHSKFPLKMVENSGLLLPLDSRPYSDHPFASCTALVVGSDDVAASYHIGVLNETPGWQKGRKSGGSCRRQLLSWRAPTSSMLTPAVTGFEMKSPDVNPGDRSPKRGHRRR